MGVGVWLVFLRKTEVSTAAFFLGSTQKSNPLSLPLQLRGAKDSQLRMYLSGFTSVTFALSFIKTHLLHFVCVT